ncbi:MAG: metal-dependent transcriptional regulator [Candidatus Omnitrophota bacterium]|nr:MAG: metal-dependent transcriptional regulator [Candidatus Omnitrophota bacterium]
MNHKRERDEHLERLWYMREEGKNLMEVLKSAMGENFDASIIYELSYEGFVELSEEDNKIILTKKGDDYARRLIRAHRLAERLIYNILGSEFESGACEFEHTVTLELVDSICTLLGHPRECPHGMSIPQGECCQHSAKTAQCWVIPLTELEVGQSVRIAYVICKNDQQLHKIDGLQIRPGAVIKLHQSYPAYVIECEGANIALDKEIASSICVWKEPWQLQPTAKETFKPASRSDRGGRRGFMFKHKR